MRMASPEAVQHSRWPTILLIVGAGIVSAFQVGKAPMALAEVQADLGLDLATVSWLLSAFAAIGALAGIVAGIAVDHVGARRLVLGGLVLQGACSAISAFAQGAPLLLTARVVEGLGFLTVSVAAPTLIVAVAPRHHLGRAIAIWGTFMPVGMAMVMLGAPWLTTLGWRGFWLVNAAILVSYAVLLAFGTRSISLHSKAHRRIMDDVLATLTARGPWMLASLMVAFGAAFFAVFAFLPTILSERLAVDAETGNLLSAGAVAANAIGNLLCGVLLARGASRAAILLLGFVTMALCGFGIFGAMPGASAYALCVVFSAVGGLIPVALLDAASRQAPHPALVGATVGFVMQGNNVGLVLGPAITGLLAVTLGWLAIPYFLAAIALLAAWPAYALRRPRT